MQFIAWRFGLCGRAFLRQPNGGQFEATVDGGAAQHISTAGETTESGFFEIDAPQKGENSFEIKTTSGSVRMFGAVLENDGPGVVYDSLAMTPDRFIPGGAPAIQHALGLQEIPALDIRAACANTLYALQLARALIQSNIANHVAVCLAEVQSPFLDLSPPAATLSMLFGDGAAALIVSGRDPTVRKGAIAPPLKILDVFLATNGEYVDDLGIRCPGTEFGNSRSHDPNDFPSDYLPRMNGQSVILQASRRMVSACQTVLERHELSANDVRWVVPHQANANLLAQVARGLGLSQDACEVISVLEESGNTSSASMGIALDTLRHSGKIDGGDYVLLPAFAAGFTWGAALCQA